MLRRRTSCGARLVPKPVKEYKASLVISVRPRIICAPGANTHFLRFHDYSAKKLPLNAPPPSSGPGARAGGTTRPGQQRATGVNLNQGNSTATADGCNC